MSVHGTTSNHVLLNLPEAADLTLAGIGVQGSVLAPGPPSISRTAT